MKIKYEDGYIMVKPNGEKKYYQLYHRIKNKKYSLYIKKDNGEEQELNISEMKEFLEFVEGIDL